jgi:AcrR family transcriptional regulator
VTRTAGHDRRTRRRLLDAATRLFAERGFKHVTVRAICHEARANVAAVNYHFRDKLGLYREVLEEAAVAFVRLTDEVKQAGAGLPAEGRLRAYIGVHCAHMRQAGATNRWQALIHRELQDPTELLPSVVDNI